MDTIPTEAHAFHSLSLQPRQRAMLDAMGIRDWWPAPPDTADAQPTHGHPAEAADQPVGERPDPPVVAVDPPRPAPTAPGWASTADPALNEADWDALTDRIRSCQACGLCQDRRQAVPGTGHRQARWMIVGEAPGEQEDKQGLPFVGPAGQLLDAMLAAMGFQRDADVYIANVIKCRPPRNRNPEPDEIARCLPYLERQIELVNPDILLALGRFAAQALLRDTVPDVAQQPLGRLRGQVYTVQGRPVVVSYHPAYLLRNPADKGKVWADLCLAMDHMGYNPLVSRPA